MNYSYVEVMIAADQVALQAALPPDRAAHGHDGEPLPKPVTGVNGNGMHTNLSLNKNGKNAFWDPKGEEKPGVGYLIDRILDERR